MFAKADTLVDEFLSCPRIKVSMQQTSVLDGVDTGDLLSDFAQRLRRENADVPVFYFSFFDSAGISQTLFLNQNSKTKERGSWVPFER